MPDTDAHAFASVLPGQLPDPTPAAPDTLWNTRYLNAAIEQLGDQGHPVRDEDVTRLSPFGHAHLNVLGRYTFTSLPGPELRPLRDPTVEE